MEAVCVAREDEIGTEAGRFNPVSPGGDHMILPLGLDGIRGASALGGVAQETPGESSLDIQFDKDVDAVVVGNRVGVKSELSFGDDGGAGGGGSGTRAKTGAKIVAGNLDGLALGKGFEMFAPFAEVEHFGVVPVEGFDGGVGGDVFVVVIHLDERGVEFFAEVLGEGGFARCAESGDRDDEARLGLGSAQGLGHGGYFARIR